MAARSISTATVSFGLVSIPVKIYTSAESTAGVHFNMLHEACGSRLKQQYYCPKEDVVVPRSEIVKGYEFAKGQYVMFTDEELEAIEEPPTHTIEITEFLDTVKVDPIYFDRSYYLGPDKGGDRAYRLLAEALGKSGRSAIAKYAARGKQYIVLLRPYENALVMQQLRYADEIRPVSEVPLGNAEVKPAELKLALQIVDQAVTDEFKPEQYEDEVKLRAIGKIEQKVEGKEITQEPVEEPKAQVIDLMAALRSSLEQTQGGRKPAQREPRRAAAKSARTTKKAKASRG